MPPDRPGLVGPHHRFGNCQWQLWKVQPAQFLGCEFKVPLPEPGPAVPQGLADENVETAHNVVSELEGDLFRRRGGLNHQTDNRRVAARRLREAAGPAGQGRRALRPCECKPGDMQRCRQVHANTRDTWRFAVVRHQLSIGQAPSRRLPTATHTVPAWPLSTPEPSPICATLSSGPDAQLVLTSGPGSSRPPYRLVERKCRSSCTPCERSFGDSPQSESSFLLSSASSSKVRIRTVRRSSL